MLYPASLLLTVCIDTTITWPTFESAGAYYTDELNCPCNFRVKSSRVLHMSVYYTLSKLHLLIACQSYTDLGFMVSVHCTLKTAVASGMLQATPADMSN